MKEKIFNALKTKFSSLGLGDDQLNLVAGMYGQMVTDENQIDTVIAGAGDTLRSMQSQADSLRTAQADLERLRTPTPPTPPVPPTPPTPKGGDTALLAAITTLTEKVNSFEESKNKDTLQGQNDALKASAKAKMLLDGATSDMADKILGGISVTEGATLESIHATGMETYNFFKTNLAPEAGSPGAPNGNPDGTVTQSTREKYFADRKAKVEEQAKN